MNYAIAAGHNPEFLLLFTTQAPKTRVGTPAAAGMSPNRREIFLTILSPTISVAPREIQMLPTQHYINILTRFVYFCLQENNTNDTTQRLIPLNSKHGPSYLKTTITD
jgi:hypothetical protein